MEQVYPLTASGIGIRIDNPDVQSLKREVIEQLLAKHHFIVFKHLNWTAAQLQAFLEKFGELVRNESRDEETQLNLDGKRTATEVIRGNGRLPLHRDGLLMNAVVKYVGILCLDFQVTSGGRTYISDSGAAWHEFPEEIKTALQENGIEGMPHDVTYYLKNEAKWYPFPGIFEFKGKTYLNGSLHYHKGERASYSVRIRGIDEALSYEYYTTMEAVLESDKYTYYHEWEKGDMLLFDNRTVLHGRESFEGERSLVQMQVKESV